MDDKSKLKWYEGDICTLITLKKFGDGTGRNIQAEKSVTDPLYINQVTDLLNELPVEGEMFISFTKDVNYLEMELTCDGKISTIEFYNFMPKTPSTSFHNKSNVAQQKLGELIKSQLK